MPNSVRIKILTALCDECYNELGRTLHNLVEAYAYLYFTKLDTATLGCARCHAKERDGKKD